MSKIKMWVAQTHAYTHTHTVWMFSRKTSFLVKMQKLWSISDLIVYKSIPHTLLYPLSFIARTTKKYTLKCCSSSFFFLIHFYFQLPISNFQLQTTSIFMMRCLVETLQQYICVLYTSFFTIIISILPYCFFFFLIICNNKLSRIQQHCMLHDATGMEQDRPKDNKI